MTSRARRRTSPVLLWVAALFGFLQGALALAENLAGVVDWHKPLIGIPLLEPSPPTFVDTPSGRRILALTRKNVFAALDSSTGEIAWRHGFEDEDPVVSYHVQNDVVLLLSGPGASTTRLFNLTTGRAIWEKAIHTDIKTATLTSPPHLGTDAAFTPDGEAVVVMSDGRRLSKLRLTDGEMMWGMDAPGGGGTILFKQIIISGEHVHVLALTSSYVSQTLTTLSLSLETSVPIGDFTQIPSILDAPSNAIIAASEEEGGAKVVWYEHGRIRISPLDRLGRLGHTKDLLPGRGRKYARILGDARQAGWVLAQMENGGVDIVNVKEERVQTTIEGSEDEPGKSQSVYSVTKTSEGPVFNRIYWSFVHNWAVFETTSFSRSLGTVSSGYSFAFDTAAHGQIIAIGGSSNTIPTNLKSTSQLSSIVITTSSGAIELVTPETILWTREESLSELAALKFVDLGEAEVEAVSHLLTDEWWIQRVVRHLLAFRHLPRYVFHFIKRFTTAGYSSALAIPPLQEGKLHRTDAFGLQKLVIAVTTTGKIIAMDSSNGATIWARNLGKTSIDGAELEVTGVWKVRGGADAMLAILALRHGEGVGGEETVAFHVDAMTGAIHGDRDHRTGFPLGKTLFPGPSKSAFLVSYQNCGTGIQVLAAVDSSEHLHIFPSCNTVASKLSAESGKLFFTTSDFTLSGPVLKGHGPIASHVNTSWTTSTLWAHPFAQGEVVTGSSPVVYESIASVGRALGDKNTLYKYLNPHLQVITTAKADGQGGVYVIDSINGNVVYSGAVEGRGLQAAMVENWLVFAWKDGKGWKITSVELFERDGPLLATPGASSHGAEHPVEVTSQTWFLPSGVKALGFTSSKFGVTAKDLLYVNSQNLISGIPRRLLDPRRPIGKPTKADQEEMLIPYDPTLPYDTKRIVSHRYPLLLGSSPSLGSSPALVESTSLLAAWGLDIFVTRSITPSGSFDILSDTFNKGQLVLVLSGLAGGIAMAGPAVQRKFLKMRWYS